jgi:spore maturation protein CgeB
MNQKVLIIGPSFFGYNQSFQQSFQQLGYDTQILSFDEPIHPFTIKNAILHKLFPKNQTMQDKSRTRFNREVMQVHAQFKPDLVFIYNGDILNIDTIRLLKQQSRVAIWMLDGAFLHPRSIALAPYVDAYFCFEKSDVELLLKAGVPAYFLPQGYDPAVYFPMEQTKDIDILFVGTLYRYPERIRLLKRVVDELGSKYSIKIYGRYKPLFKNPLQWLTREHRATFMNKNIAPQKVNQLYNRAKVCINIHHDQTQEGANPKVFEICGAGTFQVVDYNPYIASVYKQEEVAFYHSDQELIDSIRTILENQHYTKAIEAQQIVSSEHTFTDRIRQALHIIEQAQKAV